MLPLPLLQCSLQLIILLRAPLSLLHRILALILVHLAVNDLVRVQPQLIQHVLAVHHHVGKLLPHNNTESDKLFM